jgi:hypothetical protein
VNAPQFKVLGYVARLRVDVVEQIRREPATDN